MIGPFLVLSRLLESVPFAAMRRSRRAAPIAMAGAARALMAALRWDALSEGFAGGVRAAMALDSDRLLLGDADRSGASVLGSVCLVGGEGSEGLHARTRGRSRPTCRGYRTGSSRFGHAGRDC
jgi:hypothetical protein